jgi:hypothetical protein
VLYAWAVALATDSTTVATTAAKNEIVTNAKKRVTMVLSVLSFANPMTEL